MFCPHCGNEIEDGSKFCTFCGEKVQAGDSAGTDEAGVKPEKAPAVKKPARQSAPNSQPSVQLDDLVRIVVLVFAGLYTLKAVLTIPAVFRNFFGIFSHYGKLISFSNMLMSVVTIMVYLIFAYILLLFAISRTEENAETLFLGVAGAGALRIVVALVRIIITFIVCLVSGYHYAMGSAFISWLKIAAFALVIVGGLFIIFMQVAGQKFLVGRSMDELKDMTRALMEVVADESRALLERLKGAGASSAASGAERTQNQRASAAAGGAAGGAGENGSYSGPTLLKTDRSLLMYILLSLVTCGIYSFYFVYSIARDINVICQDDGKKTPGLLPYIGLTLITCGIYSYIWDYNFANRLHDNAPKFGLEFKETGTTVFLWSFFGFYLCMVGPFVAWHIKIKNLNELAKAYNERTINENSAQ